MSEYILKCELIPEPPALDSGRVVDSWSKSFEADTAKEALAISKIYALESAHISDGYPATDTDLAYHSGMDSWCYNCSLYHGDVQVGAFLVMASAKLETRLIASVVL